MAAVLKLVNPPKSKDHPRPFRTLYFDTRKLTDRTEHVRIGRAGSQVGAIRAAVVNVITRKYGAADIHNDAGVRLYRVRFSGRKLEVLGYFHELELV